MFKGRPGAAIRIAVIAISAIVSLATVPVHGGQHRGSSSAAAEISADAAAAIARQATGGRVLKVERKGGVYRVRVLLDGERVRNLSIDARTGRVLN